MPRKSKMDVVKGPFLEDPNIPTTSHAYTLLSLKNETTNSGKDELNLNVI